MPRSNLQMVLNENDTQKHIVTTTVQRIKQAHMKTPINYLCSHMCTRKSEENSGDAFFEFSNRIGNYNK